MRMRRGRLSSRATSVARPRGSASASCARPRSTSAAITSDSAMRRRRRSPRFSSSPRMFNDGATMSSEFAIHVAKENLKFAAAHFIAYPGFREPLHGHNYQVSVKVEADLGPDGYVLDFGLVKRVARELCAELDERVLLPAQSDCLVVTQVGDDVEVTTE